MTNDELVQFAAGKVGGDLLPELVNGRPYMRLWNEEDGEYDIVRVNLTSPDLFFKGLAVLVKLGIDFVVEPKGVGIEYREFTGEFSDFDIHSAYKDVHSVNEITQKFWECWAEAEGGR